MIYVNEITRIYFNKYDISKFVLNLVRLRIKKKRDHKLEARIKDKDKQPIPKAGCVCKILHLPRAKSRGNTKST